MPVEKISGAGSRAKKIAANAMCACKPGGESFGKKVIFTLFGIFLVYGIVLFGTMIRNNLQRYRFIGKADALEHTITLEGEGKVAAVPNLAVITVGAQAAGATVTEAQQKSSATMEKLITRLKGLGVGKADIKTTNYSIYPRLKYLPKKGSTSDGYEANQTVTIKIRDLNKINQALILAGEVGANSVNGVQFTIEDPEVYRAQARDLALQKITDKLGRLASALAVRVIGVAAYNEYEPAPGSASVYGGADIGGSLKAAETEAGGSDVVLHVSVTYHIE